MRRLLAAVVALIAVVALGAVLGWLWESLAPRVSLFVASDGKPYPEGYQPEGYMTDDGIAALLCLAAGLIIGLAAVWVCRRAFSPERSLIAALVSCGFAVGKNPEDIAAVVKARAGTAAGET
ncbi:MAG: hypothetical protein ACO3UX_03860, partial [Candidatus Nanopelagicales bacterium]